MHDDLVQARPGGRFSGWWAVQLIGWGGLGVVTLWSLSGPAAAPRDLLAISGTVRADGRPLASGVIEFEAVAIPREEGEGSDAYAVIRDGRFALPPTLVPGLYAIRVYPDVWPSGTASTAAIPDEARKRTPIRAGPDGFLLFNLRRGASGIVHLEVVRE